MQKAPAALLITFVAAVALGSWSFVAIRQAAGRRAALVDDLAARVPAVPRARLLVAWAPVVDADLVHATYCLDDPDAAGAAARFAATLAGAGWHVRSTGPDPSGHAVAIALTGPGYHLRGLAAPGHRPDCDGKKGQTVLALEAAVGGAEGGERD